VQIHVVQQGESVSSIAREYGISAALILQVNHLPSSTIVTGQTLLIPSDTDSYVVMPGDSLSTIAQRYNIDINELLELNPQVRPQSLYPGEIIRLPAIQRPTKMVLGFLELTNPQMDRFNVIHYGPYSTYLALFGHGMNENGSITQANDETALETAKQTRTVPAAVFSNLTENTFSAAVIHAMLAQPDARQRYITQLLSIVSYKGYGAVVIDFENIQSGDHDSFMTFLQELSTRLNPLSIPFAVAVMPITGEEPQGDPLIKAYDYAAIARYATYVIVMAYNWSWASGTPGAIAPFHKVEESIKYALTQMQRNQVLLGIVRYGYDWLVPYHPQEVAGVVDVENAVAIAIEHQAPIEFDPVSLTPWFTYWDTLGSQHLVWFEDERSLQLKLQLVHKYQLPGIAPWQLGQRFPQFIPLVLNNFRIQQLR